MQKKDRLGEKMYLVVGLGNPEENYSNTRHNMGFNTINKLAKQGEILVNKKKFKGLYGTGIIENQKSQIIDKCVEDSFLNSLKGAKIQ